MTDSRVMPYRIFIAELAGRQNQRVYIGKAITFIGLDKNFTKRRFLCNSIGNRFHIRVVKSRLVFNTKLILIVNL